MSLVSIVIPAYNEEKRIKKSLKELISFFPKVCSYEVIVVCDGTDKTREIVRSFNIKHKEIKLLEFQQRLGKGGAIIEGFKVAKGKRICFADVDLSCSPAEIYKLIKELKKVDIVIATREHKESKILIYPPYYRIILGRLYNMLVNLLFGLGLTDTQCGFKAFTKKSVQKLIPKLKSRGFEFDVELLYIAKTLGLKVKEISVQWKYKPNSSIKILSDVKNMGLGTLNLWLKLKFSSNRFK